MFLLITSLIFTSYHHILCMLKNVEDVEDYFDLQDIQHALTYIKFGMAGLKIGWILRKLWAKMCVYVLLPSLTSSTYIALQPLDVFDLSSTSLTYFNIHSIWWYGWKALSLSFSQLLEIENQLKSESYEQKCVCMFFSHLHHLWHT